MAMAEMVGGFWYPRQIPFVTDTPSYSAMLMDASTESIAVVLRAPKAGTIKTVQYRTGSSATAVNGLKVSIQGITSTLGIPDGVIAVYRNQTSGFATNSWMTPGILSDDGTDNGNKLTVTRGQKMAVVYSWVTWNAGNTVRVVNTSVKPSAGYYGLEGSSGIWSNQIDESPVLAIQYSDDSWCQIGGNIYPFKSLDTDVVSTTTSPDEVGLAFSFPVPVLMGGALARISVGGDCDLCLYNSSYTLLASVFLDKDQRVSSGAAYTEEPFPITLLGGNETYYLTVKPTTTTSLTLYSYSVNDTAMLNFLEGGAPWQFVQRTDAGSWITTATKRPLICVNIIGIDHEIGGQPSVGFQG